MRGVDLGPGKTVRVRLCVRVWGTTLSDRTDEGMTLAAAAWITSDIKSETVPESRRYGAGGKVPCDMLM